MLRRTQSVSLDAEAPAPDGSAVQPAPAAADPSPATDAGRTESARARYDFDNIRSQIQRNFAAHMDLGTPDGETPAPTREPERFTAAPRVERRRIETLRAEVQRGTTVTYERRRPLGGMRITSTRLALLVVALAAGGLAAFLILQHDQPSAPPAVAAVATPAAPPPEPQVQVLVAKDAVPMGQRLTPAAMVWAAWPQSAIRPEFVTEAATPSAIADLSGSVAKSDILPGDPIRRERLAPPGSGYLSAMLGDGMRAVSTTVTADAASGGFVVPNDHVDVVLTRTNAGTQSSETILTNARVIGINTKLSQSGTTAPGTAGDAASEAFSGQAIATLELTPEQAEIMVNASGLGKLSLVLRPTSETPNRKAADELAANAQIRLTSPFWSK